MRKTAFKRRRRRSPSDTKKTKTNSTPARKRRASLSLPNPLGAVWGARNIGQRIGKNERAAFYLLESGRVPGRKVGAQWCSTDEQLIAYLRGEGDADA
jgi:hypothetical protein